MTLNNNQYISLKLIVEGLINAAQSNGIDVRYDAIRSYINKAVAISGLTVDADDTQKLFTEIEYQFKITHTSGEVIFDNYDEIKNWYSNNNIEDPFFWNRYHEYLLKKSRIDKKSIDLMDQKTLPEIMNCLGDPKYADKQLRRGLIIGDVQSGKTATYIGLICKAADAGYKVVILLAGITEVLRKQTQERIDEGIIGITNRKVGKKINTLKVGVGTDNLPLRATSFTSCVSDFVANSDKIATSLEQHKSLVLFVIKKNVSVLSKLYDWLKDNNLDPIKGYVDQPMLLIDDEADNASVNTNKDETDPTRTNKLIRNICNLFKNATYVGFTATPFANVFIDPDSVDDMKQSDLFPEHFIYVLPTPSSYIGADKIFYPNGIMHSNLRYIEDIDEPDYFSDEYKEIKESDPEALNSGPFYYKHMKEWHGILPDSLHIALLCFYLANVVRDLRGDIEEPRSMLVNMSRFVKVQLYIKDQIEEQQRTFLSSVNYDFKDSVSENESHPLFQELKNIWNNNFGNIKDISFERVVDKKILYSSVSNIKIIAVNGGKSSEKLDYKSDRGLRVVAVGGLALSRGLTLEGLLISYFYRNTSTFDVLMQMGRWFGYRPNYADLFKIWISHLSADWYSEVAHASQELKDSIRQMREQELTPKDFGIKVRDYSDELQITSANKMRNSYDWFDFSYYGNIFDTPYISLDVGQNINNIKEVKNFAAKLFEQKYDFLFADQVNQKDEDINSSSPKSRYFSDVPKALVADFISRIYCSRMNVRFNKNDILDFIKSKTSKGIEKWDVVFEGGESNQYYDIHGLESIKCVSRSIYANGNVAQISSRRRLLGTREGRFALSAIQINEAESKCREEWKREANSNKIDSSRDIPIKAYFKYLPDRKPILVIMLIESTAKDDLVGRTTISQRTRFNKFVKDLGSQKLVAFAIGFPGCEHLPEYRKYKANKVFYENMFDDTDELDYDE